MKRKRSTVKWNKVELKQINKLKSLNQSFQNKLMKLLNYRLNRNNLKIQLVIINKKYKN